MKIGANRIALPTIFLFVVLSAVFIFIKIVPHGDVYETFYMARDFSLSYPKHPPITFWIVGVLLRMVPNYLLIPMAMIVSYLVIVCIVILTWKLAQEFFDKNVAYIATFSVMFSLFSRTNISLTPDLFQLLFGTLTVTCSYYVLKNGTWKYWILFVLFALLAFFSKYHTLITIAASGLPFILTECGRKRLRSKKAIVSGVIFFTIVASYLLYASTHHYTSLLYSSNYINRFSGFKVFISAIITCSVFPIMLLCLFYNKRLIIKSLKTIKSRNSFDTVFLLSNSVGFLTTLLMVSFVTIHKASTRYTASNTVFIILATIYLFYYAFENIDISSKKFKYIIHVLLFTIVIGVALFFFMDNRGDYRDLRVRFVKEIRTNVQKNVDYLIYDEGLCNQTYTLFSEKPHVIDVQYTSQEEMAKAVRNKTFILIWNPNSGIPQWVKDLQVSYPQMVIASPIFLDSEQKFIMGLKRTRYTLDFQYAYVVLRD